MSDRRWFPAALYAAGTVPLIVASYVASSSAFAIYDRLPSGVQRSSWIGYVVNGVAPFLGGVGCALALAALLSRRRAFTATWRAHASRAFAWYGLSAAIMWLVRVSRSNPDFGLWSQIITWPLAALLGALATDALLTWRRTGAAPAAV